LRSESVAADPPPETTTLRLGKVPSLCLAPQYVAEEFLRAEGFTKIEYVGSGQDFAGVQGAKAMAAGRADISMNFAAPLVVSLDAGDAIVVVAGVHVGCFVLFGTERIHSVRDLKGKTVGVPSLGSSPHVFLASMIAHVGLDANRDVNWVTHPSQESMRLLAEGRIDGYLGFPPDPQELRARKIGHVIVDSSKDRPWSQYFCCMVGANRDFVRKHPVAAKRALRAILKGDQLCALQPDLGARAFLNQGYTTNPEYVRQAMKEIPYGKWREYDPEDTVRFYALRLHEAGMIKSSPQKIIAQGTDWRFLRELRKELKA
jgi:NitT/TauT family transport system substrate-binding protein